MKRMKSLNTSMKICIFKNIDRVNCRCKGNARDDCTNVFRIYHLSDNG
jgi:hypothetical protein